jgi:hypothetical protein
MAMLLSAPFSPCWFHEEDAPQLSSMNVMSGVIARTERKQPGVIPDLRRAPTLFIGSDSGGQHSDAEYEVTGFLCSNREALADWEAARSGLRETMLPNQRRMSYKGLNDKHRQRALLPFLAAANRIPGLLFLVAIDRRIESVFHGPNEIPELKSWKTQSAERLMRTIYIASLLARGMSAEGQDLWWFTDEDEIAANEERLRLLVNLFAGLTSNYLSHKYGPHASWNHKVGHGAPGHRGLRIHLRFGRRYGAGLPRAGGNEDCLEESVAIHPERPGAVSEGGDNNGLARRQLAAVEAIHSCDG